MTTRIKATCTGNPGSTISNSSPADKFALWAPKLLPPSVQDELWAPKPPLPPDFFPFPHIPGKVMRAEVRKEIKYILSVGPFLASNSWVSGKSA